MIRSSVTSVLALGLLAVACGDRSREAVDPNGSDPGTGGTSSGGSDGSGGKKTGGSGGTKSGGSGGTTSGSGGTSSGSGGTSSGGVTGDGGTSSGGTSSGGVTGDGGGGGTSSGSGGTPADGPMTSEDGPAPMDTAGGGDGAYNPGGDPWPAGGRPYIHLCKPEWTPTQCCAFLCDCVNHLCTDSPKDATYIPNCMTMCSKLSPARARCQVFHCFESKSPTAVADHDSHCGHATGRVGGGSCNGVP